MSSFDQKFAELQVKITAVLEMLIAEFPDAAIRAKEVIDTAVAESVGQAEVQADEARGNAIAQLITGAGAMLADIVPNIVAPEEVSSEIVPE